MTTPALLVVDVQHGLCTGPWAMSDIDRVIDRINGVIARARDADVPVVFVQHHDDGPMKVDGDDWQLDARLAALPDDPRVRKTTPDAFLRTDLHALLRSLAVDRLVVCGLQSEFCIDSTVRGALAHGYPVELIADGHTTMDNAVLSAAQIAAHHTATLVGIDSFGIRVTAVAAADVSITG